MPKQLNSRTLLITFTRHYRLEDAYKIVKDWEPDTIEYDLINDLPVIYATKKLKFTAMVTKLTSEGVEFQSSGFTKPNLTNPPLRPQPQQLAQAHADARPHARPDQLNPSEGRAMAEYMEIALNEKIQPYISEIQQLRARVSDLENQVRGLSRALERPLNLSQVSLPGVDIPGSQRPLNLSQVSLPGVDIPGGSVSPPQAIPQTRVSPAKTKASSKGKEKKSPPPAIPQAGASSSDKNEPLPIDQLMSEMSDDDRNNAFIRVKKYYAQKSGADYNEDTNVVGKTTKPTFTDKSLRALYFEETRGGGMLIKLGIVNDHTTKPSKSIRTIQQAMELIDAIIQSENALALYGYDKN
jgi:hypothetical protein